MWTTVTLFNHLFCHAWHLSTQVWTAIPEISRLGQKLRQTRQTRQSTAPAYSLVSPVAPVLDMNLFRLKPEEIEMQVSDAAHSCLSSGFQSAKAAASRHLPSASLPVLGAPRQGEAGDL